MLVPSEAMEKVFFSLKYFCSYQSYISSFQDHAFAQKGLTFENNCETMPMFDDYYDVFMVFCYFMAKKKLRYFST